MNTGSILDHLILFHPDIELLNFGNPKILQMRLFLQSCRRQASPEAVELLGIQLPISKTICGRIVGNLSTNLKPSNKKRTMGDHERRGAAEAVHKLLS